LGYFKGIRDILRPFGTFCVHFVHFSGFGIMRQEKSGNPGIVANHLIVNVDCRKTGLFTLVDSKAIS
jgi:hypothetical protein